MKIACILDTFPRPSETFVLNELAALQKQGTDITVFSLTTPETPDESAVYCGELRQGSARDILRGSLMSIPLFDRRPVVLAARLARMPRVAALAGRIRGNYDVIHAHFLGVASTAGLVVSRLTGIPLTISAHANDIFCSGECIRAKAQHARTVFVCSFHAAAALAARGVPRDRITVSYHGLALTDSKPSRSAGTNEKMILAGGRFVEKKGLHLLIEALKLMRESRTDFRCVIFGDGPLRKQLAEKIRMSGLTGRVTLTGWLAPDRLSDLYAVADVFVCPSITDRSGDRDGIPNTVLEAMASGVPVAAFPTGGIPEAVEDGVTGILPGSVRALAQAIQMLLRDPELARYISSRAEMMLEKKFDINENVKTMSDTWKLLIKPRYQPQ